MKTPDARTTTATAIAESVGALLRQAREEAGLTLAAVASRTKIPERYLAQFEENGVGGPQEDVYSKIYLKAYAKFLGFDTGTLVDLYKKERARTAPPERRSAPKRHPAATLPTSAMVVTPKLIHAALLGLVVLGLAAYFAYEIKKIVAPPEISLAAPQDGLVTTERSLVIEGRTEHEVALRINGKSVSPDSDGNFRDMLDLQEGLNLITVVGAKKHSKDMTVTRRIIVMPKERPTAAGPALPEPGL
ncbi:MAG TPA: helix-turn-helix domain-containing protein [Candidatus Eisenbacteria bacterium]|jgi:transcriptional regulator with XRE-family HTH domain|nr:helix-turn-helix domain-containing protein [Candidatus Eisenbacteria bacterium]